MAKHAGKAWERRVKAIAERQGSMLDRTISEHQELLRTALSKLEGRIIDRLQRFKTTDGKLLGPKTNLKQAQRVHADLAKLFEETYGEAVRTSMKGFPAVAKEIKKSWKDMDIEADFTGVDRDMIEALRTSTYNEFIEMGTSAQEAIAKTMYDYVASGAPFSELTKAVQGALTGHQDIRGRPMTSYVDTYAVDSVMNFNNAVSVGKAEAAGLEFFLYEGTAIEDSRDFCLERMGRIFSRAEIESWNDWDWQGKAGPPLEYRGGFNCRHTWQPCDPEWFPDLPVDELKKLEKEEAKPPAPESIELRGLDVDRATAAVDEAEAGVATIEAADEAMAKLDQMQDSLDEQREKVAAAADEAKRGEARKAKQRIPPTPTAWQGEVSREQDRLIDQAAQYNGMKVEAYRKEAEEHWQKIVAEANPYVRLRSGTLEKVLEDGRLKAQAETGTSAGALFEDGRAKFENKVFGTTSETAPEDRPIYGYLSSRPAGGIGINMPVDQYGEISLELKDDVRERATITGGDSIIAMNVGKDPILYAEPLTAPTIRSAYFNKEYPSRNDPSLLPSVDHASPYTEVQVWGQVTTDDIKKVWFYEGSYTQSASDRLDKLGIPWEVIRGEKVSSSDWEADRGRRERAAQKEALRALAEKGRGG